jgi:hypothetical protein
MLDKDVPFKKVLVGEGLRGVIFKELKENINSWAAQRFHKKGRS